MDKSDMIIGGGVLFGAQLVVLGIMYVIAKMGVF